MHDYTCEKRAEETKERLETLRIAHRRDIDDVAAHTTREFLEPDDVRNREFEPCSVGFTWDRGRETVPDDRRDAAADVLTGEVSTELTVGQNVWFRLRFTIPDSMAGLPVYLRFIARPRDGGTERGAPRVEALCFHDGVPWHAFDNGHESLRLTDDADGGETFDLLVEAGTTTLWGKLNVKEFVLQAVDIYAERPAVADLHRHVSLCDQLCNQFDDDSPNYGRLRNAIVEASHRFSFDAESEKAYRDGAATALEPLEAVESEVRSDLTGQQLTAVGHAHIDLAWLWPWSETVRKCGRSFANVLRLFEEYPEFTFMQSQPHLYEWVRHRYPDQFAAIEDRIDEGRWQTEGALWVESDINNVGAEALSRQFLLGKRYFREEFDVDPEVTFIPDVFGYSAGLPGIADAADCPYFLTQKMSWSEFNEFPHNTFRWEGIDGSEVLAHFPPVDTYNGKVDVDEVARSVYDDEQNDVADDRAYLVGIGDGGGGPTREMVEKAAVVDDIKALPDVEWGSLAGLFDRLAADWDEYPVWTGELYLEKHRGTLTSQATTKRNNRRGEYALMEAELWSSIARAWSDVPYPHDELDDAWKVLLFNQFHDILPGSSVTDVYADADRDYEAVFDTASAIRKTALDELVGPRDVSETVCLTNPLSWSWAPTAAVAAADVAADGDVLVAVPPDADGDGAAQRPVQRVNAEIGVGGADSVGDGSNENGEGGEDGGTDDDSADGDDALLIDGPTVPAFGATSVSVQSSDDPPENPFDASTERLSNGLVTVGFDGDGMVSVTDLETERKVLDGPGNRLMLYRDQPREFDAWDIEADVYATGDQLPAPETTVVESGPVRATVRQTRQFGESKLVQEISLYRGAKRVVFRTHVDWHEDERLLKAHFPAAVHANSATYDTHFGRHERATHDNTSWDQARYEEAGGEWVDVSEFGYGVAVLNDSKYGVDVDGTDVSLSLLKAANYPDPDADRGANEFTYALVPHEGDAVEAGIDRRATQLNAPSRARPVAEATSLSPKAVDSESVVIEAVKRAEDSDDELVLRLYEAEGRSSRATVSFEFPISAAREVSIVEDDRAELERSDDGLDLAFDPFEIRTVAVRLAS